MTSFRFSVILIVSVLGIRHPERSRNLRQPAQPPNLRQTEPFPGDPQHSPNNPQPEIRGRERIDIDEGWRFMRYTGEADKLVYDTRPEDTGRNYNDLVADARPRESATGSSSDQGLKKWILPSANDFISDPSRRHRRPGGNPGADFPFVKNNFNDSGWELVNLPHDWAIEHPFYTGPDPAVDAGMGRLPIQGVAWYRRKLDIPVTDRGRCIYLDIDGAMSYAMVWLNGTLIGGWPYGYNSFRLDLTPYLKFGGDNQLAIRLDNPAHSSRWYPGGGIYRNVWLTKVEPVHVAQWGTFIRSKNVSPASATVDLTVNIDNRSGTDQTIDVVTTLYAPASTAPAATTASTTTTAPETPTASASFTTSAASPVAKTSGSGITIPAGGHIRINDSLILQHPMLWGPPPLQQPNLYVAITRLYSHGKLIDEYETRFGIRSLKFDPSMGLLVNGQLVRIRGVNQHHDLGALGAAFNTRAAERQLEILREAGCNAIRMAHDPPASELLDLTDRMGFLVIDEIFDCWEKGKKPLDFHLIFRDWHEPDIRAFVRRDRDHPSVIAWSFGNEVGEQYAGDQGAALAKELHDIVREEDSTRPATASMNYAKADMPFSAVMDIICLNYQGEGIRDAPAYAGLKGISTPPLYSSFRSKFPGKMIVSSETASTLSTRGTYLFPVAEGTSAPVGSGSGGDPIKKLVSAYELYTAPFGASPDKVFASQDRHPFVAGEFVWSGWDYLGEPTPYYSARSSYSGFIDLAGFKKDRFYLYQSRWRPDLPMAHILPHWTWPDRIGQITPVHVFSSADEAELFLNNRSLGKRRRAQYEYRFRWDSVLYEPGELIVVTRKEGKIWATDTMRTAGTAAALRLTADRDTIHSDGRDLSFISIRVLDDKGTVVPAADNDIRFEVSAGGEIVSTDNGDPRDLTAFSSHERRAFSGLALVIVRAKPKYHGRITITAKSDGFPHPSICTLFAQ
ncbi:MAG TPA: beta-galactosidase GalB [Puia sp.]